MTFPIQFRRFFIALLVTAVLWMGTAIGTFSNSNQAFAAPNPSNEISNVKGESKDINGSYHRLQAATQDSWDRFEAEKQVYTDSRSNGRGDQPKQALKNINENTKNAFKRTTDSIKNGLSSR